MIKQKIIFNISWIILAVALVLVGFVIAEDLPPVVPLPQVGDTPATGSTDPTAGSGTTWNAAQTKSFESMESGLEDGYDPQSGGNAFDISKDSGVTDDDIVEFLKWQKENDKTTFTKMKDKDIFRATSKDPTLLEPGSKEKPNMLLENVKKRYEEDIRLFENSDYKATRTAFFAAYGLNDGDARILSFQNGKLRFKRSGILGYSPFTDEIEVDLNACRDFYKKNLGEEMISIEIDTKGINTPYLKIPNGGRVDSGTISSFDLDDKTGTVTVKGSDIEGVVTPTAKALKIEGATSLESGTKTYTSDSGDANFDATFSEGSTKISTKSTADDPIIVSDSEGTTLMANELYRVSSKDGKTIGQIEIYSNGVVEVEPQTGFQPISTVGLDQDLPYVDTSRGKVFYSYRETSGKYLSTPTIPSNPGDDYAIYDAVMDTKDINELTVKYNVVGSVTGNVEIPEMNTWDNNLHVKYDIRRATTGTSITSTMGGITTTINPKFKDGIDNNLRAAQSTMATSIADLTIVSQKGETTTSNVFTPIDSDFKIFNPVTEDFVGVWDYDKVKVTTTSTTSDGKKSITEGNFWVSATTPTETPLKTEQVVTAQKSWSTKTPELVKATTAAGNAQNDIWKINTYKKASSDIKSSSSIEKLNQVWTAGQSTLTMLGDVFGSKAKEDAKTTCTNNGGTWDDTLNSGKGGCKAKSS